MPTYNKGPCECCGGERYECEHCEYCIDLIVTIEDSEFFDGVHTAKRDDQSYWAFEAGGCEFRIYCTTLQFPTRVVWNVYLGNNFRQVPCEGSRMVNFDGCEFASDFPVAESKISIRVDMSPIDWLPEYFTLTDLNISQIPPPSAWCNCIDPSPLEIPLSDVFYCPGYTTWSHSIPENFNCNGYITVNFSCVLQRIEARVGFYRTSGGVLYPPAVYTKTGVYFRDLADTHVLSGGTQQGYCNFPPTLTIVGNNPGDWC